ncbi:jg22863, partial [Pararge aegeria aegeria]
SSENKELLRQQLLSASKDRNVEKAEPPKTKHTRSRQKNRWKLKFHHQALPQEYLDHYEQSLQKANNKKPIEKPKEQNADSNFTNETFKIWAQRLAGVQNEAGSLTAPNSFNMAAKKDEKKKKPPAIAPSKIVTYEDLPYMGEMTLNNSKPRRGRKPKKADICHLIYENYGTVVPGQPPPQDRQNNLTMGPPFRSVDAPHSTSKTDLQNKIISNLLEKKLSQEYKRRLENPSPHRFCSPDEPMPEVPITTAGPLHSDDEPLNLCIRDLHDLKLQIQKKFGNIYTSMPEVKAEIEDTSEQESVKSEQPNAISVIQRNTNCPPTANSSPDLSRKTRNISPTLSEPTQSTASLDDDKFPGYIYWPNAGIYMHPLALQTQLLYYQRLAASGQLPFPAEDRDKLSTPGNENNLTDQSPDESKSKLVLKQISELLDPKVIKQVEETKSPEPPKKRASPNPAQGPVKRKRSAIFIPPMPAKSNSTTPTTEVSICKFKFTGGSKPSLQEKKMLSVDSGGNFRYYSGTGTKGNNKGFEYLQKDANADRTEAVGTSVSTLPKADTQNSVNLKEDLNKKKRKSRKTLQREKLEQTFKEKGFLIQTQQLQSAEGATYCKFRQLRKFTRYLFRSWKDYLPGELDDRQSAEIGPEPTATENQNVAGEWTS